MSISAELERLREKNHELKQDVHRLSLLNGNLKNLLDLKTAYAESLEAERERLKIALEHGIGRSA